MRELKGRTAIVTGGATGIGFGIAEVLSEAGVNLVLAARSAETLDAAVVELERPGVAVLAVPTDVTITESLERLVAETLGRFGRIDILVNNAGVETYRHFHDSPIGELTATIDVNLTAAIVLARLVVPHMLDRRTGHVVSVSSTAGKHGPPYGAAYGATKAGLISLTESLRIEYRGTGVSASAIVPGFTRSGGMYERIREEIGRGTPAWIGHTSTRKVARATLRAIERNRPEVIVNLPPFRPFSVLAETCPRIAEWIYARLAKRWLQKIADARPSAAVSSDASTNEPATDEPPRKMTRSPR